jgi:hypothetical protein
MTINPSSASDQFTITNVFTANDAALPGWITTSETASTIDFTVNTSDGSNVGDHTIVMTATGSGSAGSGSSTVTFKITVPD